MLQSDGSMNLILCPKTQKKALQFQQKRPSMFLPKVRFLIIVGVTGFELTTDCMDQLG